jgi:hypothetical protein
MKALMIMFGAAVDAAPVEADPIEAEFEEHGVKNGWAMWPANFDPIWMKWCTGFKKAKA